jgi:hypothetical protein
MEKELLNYRFLSLCTRLLNEQNKDGFWSGMLSSSALSTATAIVALKIYGCKEDNEQTLSGFDWLCTHINPDGGFGDTPQGESNVSTSLICYAALFYCQPHDKSGGHLLKAIENYLETKKISFTTRDITSSILKFYGKDYTFSVPILSMLIVCGVLPAESVRHIPQLPFELSLLPSSWYRYFNMQVVSYAIPALIGVGIFLHSKRKTKISLTKFYRDKCIVPAINKLTSLMPESGGFLEAIPLTGFVCMCLAASDLGQNRVVERGIVFLRNQQRKDGSWPIDTDLSTWVTTLSIKALGPQVRSVISKENIYRLKQHLLSIQYKDKHPFNGAEPGGWGWTSFSGSVPDADDTPGAILALLEMYYGSKEENDAIIIGCRWLIDLQNSDGGFPTFCKGWGRLPFDRSCADLTGHALLALISTVEKLGNDLPSSLKKMILRTAFKASAYLKKQQAADGHWLPLWFGNQLTIDKKNSVYGTAKVCIYLEDCLLNTCISNDFREKLTGMITKAEHYLVLQQNSDGSWGGKKDTAGSIEETALAISALAGNHNDICRKGFEWLDYEHRKNDLTPSPIGLYFAALWYDEKMYPLVYYIEALRRFLHS